MTAVQQAVLDRCIPEPNSGCWLWTYSIDNHGYGQITHSYGHHGKAYRVSFEAFKGPIPTGLHIDHLCRVRSCVNPDHLEPVTSAVNKLRGIGFGAIHARKTHCPHGHSFTDPANLRMYGTSRVCKTCHRVNERRRQIRRAAGIEPLKPGAQKR